MACEGVKPVLAQCCMKFHFPVKWESAEEWADLGPNPARAEWQPEASENGGLSLCQRGPNLFRTERCQEKALGVLLQIRSSSRQEYMMIGLANIRYLLHTLIFHAQGSFETCQPLQRP